MGDRGIPWEDMGVKGKRALDPRALRKTGPIVNKLSAALRRARGAAAAMSAQEQDSCFVLFVSQADFCGGAVRVPVCASRFARPTCAAEILSSGGIGNDGSTSAPPEQAMRCQTACKPGSVRIRVDARRPFLWDAHCCAPRATNPGDGAGTPLRHAAGRSRRRRRSPLFGLAPGGVYPAATVTGGAVRSCRTVSPLPTGTGWSVPAVCFLWHFPWGRPRRPLAGTVFPWSPDFPPTPHQRRQRPSGRLARRVMSASGWCVKPGRGSVPRARSTVGHGRSQPLCRAADGGNAPSAVRAVLAAAGAGSARPLSGTATLLRMRLRRRSGLSRARRSLCRLSPPGGGVRRPAHHPMQLRERPQYRPEP